MKFSSRLRRIADYVAATENEIAIDRHFLGLMGMTPSGTGYLPRVPKWAHIGQRFPGLTRAAWAALWLWWVLGGALLHGLRHFLPCWLGARGAEGQAGWPGLPGGAVFALSSRTGDIITARQFPAFPLTWYTVPWVPLRATPPGAQRVDLIALLSRAEMRRAFADALCATVFLMRRRRTRKWLLQSYTALRWFLVRAAVDKYPRQIVFAEHFDRWAVLADSAARAFKRGLNDAHGAGELVLVQHGLLPPPSLHLYRRLRQVTQLYAYGQDAEQSFRSMLLSPNCVRSGLVVDTFTPAIELLGPRHSATIRILFVGYPVCEQFHRNIYQGLKDRMSFQAFYKPHPLVAMSEAMRDVGWEVVEQATRFPAVELLVSYESTLTIEYQGAGIPAVIHPMNIDSSCTAEVLDQIGDLVAALGTRRGAA